MELLIQCLCGCVQGSAGPLSKALNRRIVCMCKDCQAFAHYLGRADQMLDDQGGTEIIPIHPGRMRFVKGIGQLACVRLSDDGLRRWYTSCCKTPVANTHPKNALPFAGVHRSVLVLSSKQNGWDEVYARVNGREARGTLRAIFSTLKFLGVGYLHGLQKPWPFPDVQPTVGTDSEYDSWMKRVREWRRE